MKNEKLEQLLNKVVEFNKPDKVNFKGFLYKDYRGYYIKVVEHISGTDIAVNDRLYLKDGEEQYVIHAEKPKLMKVSKNSFHYGIVKFVLGNNAPTPRTMQNGCPYFWILIFSIFASPFVAIWKVLKNTVLLIPELLLWSLEKLVDMWLPSVDDSQAYEYYYNGRYSTDYKMPLTAKIYFDKSDADFMDYFMLEKYKLDRNKNPEEYSKKMDELSAKHSAWRKEINERREKRRAEEIVREAEYKRRREESERKRAIRQAEWDAKMKPIREAFAKLRTSIIDTFTFDPKNLKSIIRKTKQIAGAIITIALLGVTYFIVNGLVYGLTAFIDFSIEHWWIYATIVVLAIAFGIIYILYVFFTGWVQSVVNKYHGGKRVWYVEPLIYLIYYPLKYIVLFIAYALLYVIWKPIEYIFYRFLWKLVLVNLGKLIWRGLCSFGRGLANSTGVFGEYFGASYSDYCPGIEWQGFDEDEE